MVRFVSLPRTAAPNKMRTCGRSYFESCSPDLCTPTVGEATNQELLLFLALRFRIVPLLKHLNLKGMESDKPFKSAILEELLGQEASQPFRSPRARD